ncbi:HlyD family efflux transporter periplasmic adaptor subunit [Cytophagaceae bacterium YF14B1]|uniref:HlyD family efflux transporter periplasmic adaptor subunit n=1 Tax=Xanthocytophaga flava TaxID=3048013 RepID=A0AAE3U6L6_9BACT|nr:HlyD family efflux transporter periplasmic adaptor subunit [Xanthocytophaga flavus]MDJ1480707.1 HlyD family efflux transporter periplasmic adaptor subunit [Xanthocytophaga flavus]
MLPDPSNFQKEEPLSIELRSEEVYEIINRPPPAIIRYGISLFFFAFVLIIGTSWIIEYPDIIKASFVLTSINAPKSVNAHTDGKIVRLLTSDNQNVKKGQILGYLESTSQHEEVLILADWLAKIQNQFLSNQLSYNKDTSINTFRHLGELQSDFQTFTLTYQECISFLKGGFYLEKRKLLEKELNDLHLLFNNLKTQEELYHQDYNLAESEFIAQKKLLDEKVIAPLEFSHEQSKLLAKKLPLRQAETSIMNNIAAQTAKEKEILELDKTISEQKILLAQAIHTLQSQIQEWKNKYLLIAPLEGNVYFSSFLQENQTLKSGQEVFFIGSENKTEFGQIRIPQNNFGKVKIGQRVLIRFDGYPSQEFGLVEGKIEFISNIPDQDNMFLAKVVLPKGLKTNYKQILTYKSGMTATAEIITENTKMAHKLFYSLIKVLER